MSKTIASAMLLAGCGNGTTASSAGGGAALGKYKPESVTDINGIKVACKFVQTDPLTTSCKVTYRQGGGIRGLELTKGDASCNDDFRYDYVDGDKVVTINCSLDTVESKIMFDVAVNDKILEGCQTTTFIAEFAPESRTVEVALGGTTYRGECPGPGL